MVGRLMVQWDRPRVPDHWYRWARGLRNCRRSYAGQYEQKPECAGDQNAIGAGEESRDARQGDQ